MHSVTNFLSDSSKHTSSLNNKCGPGLDVVYQIICFYVTARVTSLNFKHSTKRPFLYLYELFPTNTYSKVVNYNGFVQYNLHILCWATMVTKIVYPL